jgi:hypothetical protein
MGQFSLLWHQLWQFSTITNILWDSVGSQSSTYSNKNSGIENLTWSFTTLFSTHWNEYLHAANQTQSNLTHVNRNINVILSFSKIFSIKILLLNYDMNPRHSVIYLLEIGKKLKHGPGNTPFVWSRSIWRLYINPIYFYVKTSVVPCLCFMT